MNNSVDNSLYRPPLIIGASGIKQILWYSISACIFKSYWFPFSSLKVALLRLFGARIGNGVNIKPSVNIKFPWKLTIGNYCWIGENVWIDNLGPVIIANNVCISQGALLLAGSHDYTKRTFDLIVGEIVLEDGVWIGAKAVVRGGVTCHSHSILGINSVANANLEPYKIYTGNPAVPVKERTIS